MAGRRRTNLWAEAQRRNRESLARLGAEVRAARGVRRLTQASLGARVGVSRMTISRAERGLGGGLTLDAWQRIAIALGTTLRVEPAARPAGGDRRRRPPGDRGAGPATRPCRGVQGPRRAPHEAERALALHRRRLDRRRPRRLTVVECWNTIGDVGAAARTSARKLAEAEAIATARWGERTHEVGLVWVVRATKRNRALVARYPEVFASRFPGSSARWVQALAEGDLPPAEPGLVWTTIGATRIFAWRRGLFK